MRGFDARLLMDLGQEGNIVGAVGASPVSDVPFLEAERRCGTEMELRLLATEMQ